MKLSIDSIQCGFMPHFLKLARDGGFPGTGRSVQEQDRGHLLQRTSISQKRTQKTSLFALFPLANAPESRRERPVPQICKRPRLCLVAALREAATDRAAVVPSGSLPTANSFTIPSPTIHHTTVESVILDSYSGARMMDWLKATAAAVTNLVVLFMAFIYRCVRPAAWPPIFIPKA